METKRQDKGVYKGLRHYEEEVALNPVTRMSRTAVIFAKSKDALEEKTGVNICLHSQQTC